MGDIFDNLHRLLPYILYSDSSPIHDNEQGFRPAIEDAQARARAKGKEQAKELAHKLAFPKTEISRHQGDQSRIKLPLPKEPIVVRPGAKVQPLTSNRTTGKGLATTQSRRSESRHQSEFTRETRKTIVLSETNRVAELRGPSLSMEDDSKESENPGSFGGDDNVGSHRTQNPVDNPSTTYTDHSDDGSEDVNTSAEVALTGETDRRSNGVDTPQDCVMDDLDQSSTHTSISPKPAVPSPTATQARDPSPSLAAAPKNPPQGLNLPFLSVPFNYAAVTKRATIPALIMEQNPQGKNWSIGSVSNYTQEEIEVALYEYVAAGRLDPDGGLKASCSQGTPWSPLAYLVMAACIWARKPAFAREVWDKLPRRTEKVVVKLYGRVSVRMSEALGCERRMRYLKELEEGTDRDPTTTPVQAAASRKKLRGSRERTSGASQKYRSSLSTLDASTQVHERDLSDIHPDSADRTADQAVKVDPNNATDQPKIKTEGKATPTDTEGNVTQSPAHVTSLQAAAAQAAGREASITLLDRQLTQQRTQLKDKQTELAVSTDHLRWLEVAQHSARNVVKIEAREKGMLEEQANVKQCLAEISEIQKSIGRLEHQKGEILNVKGAGSKKRLGEGDEPARPAKKQKVKGEGEGGGGKALPGV